MIQASVRDTAAECGVSTPLSLLNDVFPATPLSTPSVLGHMVWMRANCRIENLVGGSTDGQFGFYLKRVSGAIIGTHESTTAVYPASTIKVLQHIHALRAVDAGDVTLATPTTRFAGNDRCDDVPNDGPSSVISLQNALQTMMKPSDNLSANAVQDLFGGGNASIGRDAMNETASDVIGMSSGTVLHHKFACGGKSNDPANSMTLTDMGLLYERYALDALLTEEQRDVAHDLMLNETDDRFVDGVIDAEAPLGFDTAAYKADVEMVHKAGNVSGNVSIAGWIRLPTATGNHEFVYGAFVDNSTFFTLSIRGVIAELLRDQISLAMGTLI